MENYSYVYDGEGRICAVHGPEGMIGYQYGADGARVGKGLITTMSCDITNNGYAPTNDFILDQVNGQMSEMAVGGGVSTWLHTNVTAGGGLLATYDNAGLHFYLNDPLGVAPCPDRPRRFPGTDVPESSFWRSTLLHKVFGRPNGATLHRPGTRSGERTRSRHVPAVLIQCGSMDVP